LIEELKWIAKASEMVDAPNIVGDMATMIHRAAAVLEAQEWQSIETAPRGEIEDLPKYGGVSGPTVLLSNGKKTYSGYWMERYVSGYYARTFGPPGIPKPTHWRPLPEPPK
jgi:hypothetical protein